MYFTDSNPFLVQDKANEKKFSFNLCQSIEKASQQSLLEGYKVHVTRHCKPDPVAMKGNLTYAN